MAGVVNLILQGKGGVGKSVVATLFAQRLFDLGRPPLCIDTDPVNATFSSYPKLGAHRFRVTKKGDIDRSNFDLLLERLTSLGDGGHAIVDTGATTFVPLSTYLLRFEVPSLLKVMGHQLVIHTVIAGGKPQDDTAQGLNTIVRHYDEDVQLVVWLNPRFGEILHEGKPFAEWKLYQQHRERIRALVEMPSIDELATLDLEQMFRRNQTFVEAFDDPELLLMQRQRLKMVQRDLYKEIDRAGIA